MYLRRSLKIDKQKSRRGDKKGSYFWINLTTAMMYYINLSFLFRSFSVHFYFFNTNIYILVASIWQEISVLWKRLQWGYVKMNKFPNYSQKKKPRVLLAFPRLSFFQFVPNKGIIIRLICYFLTSPQAFCFLLHKIFCFFHGETKKATGEQTICPRAMLHSYEAKKKKKKGWFFSFFHSMFKQALVAYDS